MTTAPQMPESLPARELLPLLAALGAAATVPAGVGDREAALHLAHGLVGAAERNAMSAELAWRGEGADSPQILPAVQEAYAAANAQSRLDVLAHVQWRATRLVQALQALAEESDRADELLQTAIIATAAVSGLLSAQASAATGAEDHRALESGVRALQVAAQRASRLA